MFIYRTINFEKLDEARVRETQWLGELIQKKYFAVQGTVAHVWSVFLNEKESSANIYIYTIFDFVHILSWGSQG